MDRGRRADSSAPAALQFSRRLGVRSALASAPRTAVVYSGWIFPDMTSDMTIEQCVGKTLAWIQPRFLSSAYELRLGEEVVGVLAFRNAWGSLATAEATDGCWTFKRLGFLRTRVN